ncbi:MAG TPA: translation elongation factor-like protein [Patescibacteria group bacterium]|nr:translation elongation factor-like protein [Patescibacteria group bacterium]
MNYYKIGAVTHYYDKINVAVVELESDIATGDKIKFSRGGEDMFEQEVESMQVEHEKIEKAGKGDTIGLKVKEEVKEGAEVFKLSS